LNKTRIFLNGELMGTHDDPIHFVSEFRKKRQHGEIKRQVNITFVEDTNEIYINSDPGRARRPAIIVKNGAPLITKEHIEKLIK
jgi:DNA-directed RNA polymerase beta subunit